MIGLGALTQIASTRVSLLVFAVLLATGILAAAPALLGRTRRAPSLPTTSHVHLRRSHSCIRPN